MTRTGGVRSSRTAILLALRTEFDGVSGNGTAEWDKERLAAVIDPATKAQLDAKRETALKANPASGHRLEGNRIAEQDAERAEAAERPRHCLGQAQQGR